MRYPEYDYSLGGGYFVTQCAYKMLHLFGDVTDGKILLSPFGQIIKLCWQEIPTHFNFVELDTFVVMPNHVHGIIFINEHLILSDLEGAKQTEKQSTVGAKHASPLQLGQGGHGSPPGSLSAIIASFKSSVTRIARSTLHFQAARNGQYLPAPSGYQLRQ